MTTRVADPALTTLQPPVFRFRLWHLFILTALVGCVFAFYVALIRPAQRVAIRMQSQSPLNQLSLALHNYHVTYGQFPPAFIADEQGRPMHSWRILVLPFIESGNLYAAYNFQEPWNGPNNSRLLRKMPHIYRTSSEPESDTNTNIVVIVGPDTAFPGATTTSMRDFVDGLENTILLTEITQSDIPWLEPRDLSAATELAINAAHGRSISAVSWRQPFVNFADGIKTYDVSNAIPVAELRSLTTIAGNEPVTRAQLIARGYLMAHDRAVGTRRR